MKRGLLKFFLVLFSILVFTNLSLAANINLWNIFPKSQHGENGIYLIAYNEQNSTFRQLDNLKDYLFGTAGTNWSIPYIARTDDSKIVTHPRGFEFGGGYTEQTFLLLSFPKEVYLKGISGIIDPYDGGNIQFFITGSKMDGSYWQLYNVNVTSNLIQYSIGAFDKPIQFLAFQVAPNGNSFNDTTFYTANIEYTPVPLPATLVLLFSGFGLLPLARRKI